MLPLKCGQNVDVLVPDQQSNGRWCVGTVTDTNSKRHSWHTGSSPCSIIKVAMLETWVRVDHAPPHLVEYFIAASGSSQRFFDNHQLRGVDQVLADVHTHTVRHYYLSHPQVAICKQPDDAEGTKCSECNRQCCTECNICIIDEKAYCAECLPHDFCSSQSAPPCCSFCNLWVKGSAYESFTCQKCDKLYCLRCGLRSGLCRKCNIMSTKQRKYCAPISSALDDMLGGDILDVIASFCMGYIVPCHNTAKCANLIVIDDETKFRNSLDEQANTIYKYKLRRILATQYKESALHFIYGAFWRVFCWQCAERSLRECGSWKCKNRDVQNQCHDHSYCCVHSRWAARDKMKEFVGSKPPKCCTSTRSYEYSDLQWKETICARKEFIQQRRRASAHADDYDYDYYDNYYYYGVGEDDHLGVIDEEIAVQNSYAKRKHREKRANKKRKEKRSKFLDERDPHASRRRKKDKRGNSKCSKKFNKRHLVSLQF